MNGLLAVVSTTTFNPTQEVADKPIVAESHAGTGNTDYWEMYNLTRAEIT